MADEPTVSQSKADLDHFYSTPDPWEYKRTADDIRRKQRILEALPKRYKRALDIGCGEGWISTDLPANTIHGIELSDVAASRFPDNVRRVDKPQGTYDLVVATGVLYKQYDYQQIIQWIQDSAINTVLTSHIKSWELPLPLYKEVYTEQFPYREFTQVLRIYEVTA